MKNRTLLITALLSVYLLISGCSLRVAGVWEVKTYIDSPPTETIWFTEMPIAITIHVINISEPSSVTLKIENTRTGVIETLDSSLGRNVENQLYQAKIPWTAHQQGRYKLTAEFTPLGSGLPTHNQTHTIYLTIEQGRGGVGGPEPTPLPTMPASAGETPAPWIDLWADQYTLDSGACTTLRWDSQHVDQLVLNGEAVAFTGSRQVCPDISTAYLLRGSSAVGQKELRVDINVSPPAAPVGAPSPEAPESIPVDTASPTLGDLQLSIAKVFDNPACGPDSVTIAINAQDPGGIAKIELHYRGQTDSATGIWRVKTLAARGGGSYAAILGQADFSSSLPIYTPGRVYVLVKAWDNAGNMSQTMQMSFETEYCLQ